MFTSVTQKISSKMSKMIFTVGCLTILFNCVSGQSANEQDVLDAFTDVYDIMYGIRDDQAKQIQELVDKDLKKTEEIKFLKVQIEELQKKQGPKGKEGPEGERGAQGEPQGPTDLWFVACEAIQVTGDTSSDVFSEGGLYLPTDKRASDAPNNPVWRNSLGNRFIFNTLSTDGWKIGSEDGLTTGNYWCKSGSTSLPISTSEEWSGVLVDGVQTCGSDGSVQVKCIKINDL